ncbi:hypothetical protein DLAC_10772 [Tieghemostelium lacteum]|uniref:Uncharacterized protein n=1 Tax=Tieghemostelium lacteum TaxID=361077 RepID=A0A151Z444_TIELA|nr:hypothetical protein DLAC_10772 [Tieghemostelium lacteum]|eukprot:KYQ88743.1 hypothetical protein DLAC_10772 [Tieghemostelium lacteum]
MMVLKINFIVILLSILVVVNAMNVDTRYAMKQDEACHECECDKHPSERSYIKEMYTPEQIQSIQKKEDMYRYCLKVFENSLMGLLWDMGDMALYPGVDVMTCLKDGKIFADLKFSYPGRIIPEDLDDNSLV